MTRLITPGRRIDAWSAENYTLTAAPRRLPLVGHALPLRAKPLAFLEELRDLADITSFGLGPARAYLLNHPDLVHQVLVGDSDRFTKGVLFEKGRRLLGNGLATSEGAFHTRQRRLVQPAFGRRDVERHVDTMRTTALDVIRSWRHGESVPVDRAMAEITSTIATGCLFSTDLARKDAGEIQRHMKTVFDGAGKRAYAPVDAWYRLPTRANRAFDHSLRRLHGHVDRIIADYRASGLREKDFLSVLLDSRDDTTGEAMTDQQVHDEVVTILAGGTETSSSALTWTYHLLARDPQVARRVHEEIDAVLGGRPIRFEDVARLEYVNRVVHESLRLFPPIWLLPRTPVEDVLIGGHPIPAGAQVFFSPFALHRDRRWFPRPHRFDPDRWLPERARAVPRGAYIPFGAGNRNCVGGSFGFTEIVVVLATVSQRWRLAAPANAAPSVTALTTLHLDGADMTALDRNEPRGTADTTPPAPTASPDTADPCPWKDRTA
ncbi:cytochrome P450 [Streptomyces sp. NPDC055607]